MISLLGAGSRKTLLMSDIHKAKVKEQAEAYLRQLRTIPYSNALPIMEDLLNELYRLREQTHYGQDYNKLNESCDRQDEK